MIRCHVTLTVSERDSLELIVSKGSHKSQKITQCLDSSDQCKKQVEIIFNVSIIMVRM